MNKSKKVIIILIFILLCILCSILTLMTILIKKENYASNNINVNTNVVISDKKVKTVEDVIKKYDSEYVSQDRDKIYIIFSKDLYDENGSSNEKFFRDFAEDLTEFFPKTSFYMIDNEKNITIYAKYSPEENCIILIINNNENFYKDTNGKEYSEVNSAKIVEETTMLVSNPFLERLEMNSMYFRYIENYLTNGKEMDDGYTVYTDQKIKVKLSPNQAVFNLVFMEDYEDKILYNLSLKNKLGETAELYKNYEFGGLDKGYLGYRGGSFYYFFYENEVSVYPYSYRENTTFESLLATYLQTKDMESFVNKLKMSFKGYSDFEYDADIQKLYILYPTRGIKIDIKDNDPRGITLYSNYYFTDMTRQLVKDGKVKYIPKDYVNEYEQTRKATK